MSNWAEDFNIIDARDPKYGSSAQSLRCLKCGFLPQESTMSKAIVRHRKFVPGHAPDLVTGDEWDRMSAAETKKWKKDWKFHRKSS